MKFQNRPTTPRVDLIPALVGLVIALALPFLSINVAALAERRDSVSTSSTSGGENPLSLNRWGSNGPDGGSVFSLAIDPGNTATIYSGTGSGLFKSTNGGASWNPLNVGASALAIDPITPTILYANANGVSKSTDGGASWRTINNGLANQYGTHLAADELAIDPITPTTVYASTQGGGVFKTTNGGTSWNTINNGLAINPWGDIPVRALAINPTNPNVIYASLDVNIPDSFQSFPAIFKSTNGGANWSQIFNGFGVASFLTLLVTDPINPNTIYAGGYSYSCCGGVVLKSINGGGGWSQSNLSGSVSVLAIDPTNPNIIYSGGSDVLKSTNGGQSWSAFSNGLPHFGVGALAIDPVNPNFVYVGTMGKGVFESTNRGASWTAANNGLHAVNVLKIAISPGSANRIFTESYSGVYKSADDGESWAPGDFYPLAFDHTNPNVMYAIVSNHLSKSTDGGTTWRSANTGLDTNDIRALAIDPNNSEVIYAGTGGSLFKTTNGGESWSAISNIVCPELLAIDPGNSQTLYAVASYDCYDYCTTVYKSTDGGVNWIRSDSGTSFYYVSALVIDPLNTQTIYVSDGGIVKSTDGGGSWNAVIRQPGASGVSSVVVDPVQPNVIYAGTYGEGVFMSADGGASWNPLNDGLTNPNVNALAIDATGSFLHAGTPAGVFDYQFSCSYTTSSASQSFPPGGATGSVSVTATTGCIWQASGSVSWITINSGSASGNGTVSFSVGANTGPFPRTATLNIAGQTFTVNQFGAPPINSADDTQFFVRQHYLDFLNRQSDPTGLDFWTNNITSCGFDTRCFEVKRIDTSAAFFLSIEFQQTGYLVYRFYKAAYGNLPDAPVPLRFSEFLADTQKIGQGVIVNQAGWETVLENNKQAFSAEYVQRSRFTSAYPTSLTPGQFVDQLFMNAGVTPSATERMAAIHEFGSATMTTDTGARARALRRVAENSTFAQQEFNHAFVLMQYFGYLRRNPNDPPEPTLDFQGYNFWLNKLNQFNGNFVQADMVKSFLVSGEYRQRFGP